MNKPIMILATDDFEWSELEQPVKRLRKARRRDPANAGTKVEDAEVVIDGNLLNSCNPHAIPAFSTALIKALREQARTDDAAKFKPGQR